MTITAPTRITIEVHPGAGSHGSGAPFVRVMPEPAATSAQSFHAPEAADLAAPAAYDPGECLCLDDEDCAADHAND